MSAEIKDVIHFVSPDGGIAKMTLGNFKESDVAQLIAEMKDAGWELQDHKAVIKPDPRGNWVFLGLILGIVLQSLVTTIVIGW